MTRVKVNPIHRLLLLLLLSVPAPGREALLRWNNGDVLLGTLRPSDPGQIRWSSPVFADELVVDTNALDSIEFPAQRVQATEAFRVGTVSGDVFAADLVGSSEAALFFTSQRHGPFQVKRDSVYSLQRTAHPNLVFDGSQFGAWKTLIDGPIKNLTYRVYKGDWTWGDAFPDVTELTSVYEGWFEAGYLDLGLSKFRERFALSFEGDIVVPVTGQYRFEGTVDDQAVLWIDGKQISNEGRIALRYESSVALAQGRHSLRLDYVDMGGESHLSFRMVNPKGQSQSLTPGNQASGWRRGMGGHAQSDRKQASLFHAVELPHHFEIDLSLASVDVPQFVLATGKDRASAESNQALRVETWGDELVVVQDTLFQPIMTLEKHMREVRLRLVFDSDSGELQVFAASGDLLVTVKGVRAVTGQSGLCLRNRGADLTVRRLSVYRQLHADAGQVFETTRARVHLTDGQVVYGRLHVADRAAHVVDPEGTRRDIDLDKIDRIAGPGAPLAVTTDVAELTYTDGAVVRGWVDQASVDQVKMRTAFSDQPVTCALAGASMLRFGASSTGAARTGDTMDQLFTAAGRLRGRLSFELAGSPLSWQPPGAAKPLRLARTGTARVARRNQSIAKGPSFDTTQFPCVLHLKNGERLPCRVSSYDQAFLGLQSPWIEQDKIDSIHVKAIDFGPASRLDVDPAKLERALTVPRFSRDNPPSHILMARNGDLKRGRLVGIRTQTIEFESKLRKQTVPVERLARVVNVSKAEHDPTETPATPMDLTGRIRVTLADGSILIFNALESRGGKLIGRSDIYGDIAIPTDQIEALNLGGFEQTRLKSLFEEWVVLAAQEPQFNQDSPPISLSLTAEDVTVSSPDAATLEPNHLFDVAPGDDIDTAVDHRHVTNPVMDPALPTLGKVRIDPRDRSLRFPVLINQRIGAVEYALVTDEGKTHESVFRTDTQPLHIHVGLLLLDATPSYARKLPEDPLKTLPGESVLIDIAWTENGVERSRPLGDFILTTHNASRLSRGPWVYNGSVLSDYGIAAQTTGSIVSVWLDPGALINNPRPGRENDELYQANPTAFPAGQAEFEMVIRVVKDKDSG